MAYHDGTNYVLYCIALEASLGTCPLTQGYFAFDPRVLGHEP